ncbi:MAG TPA: ATP-binding cassette domain-containing protein [Actinomycetota bacterium]|nr:ATP-binding cassette domain-containing protein [Actinomycetota bacterium]
MIEVRMLTKRHGVRCSVDHLTFDALPGRVTGLLGPPRAGKSTVLRIVMGLVEPDSGVALVNGRPFHALRESASEIGALLFPRAFHPAATVATHLGAQARAGGIPEGRVAAALDQAGLGALADRRAASLSPAQAHRLGIATALLGVPETLILDAPPAGVDAATRIWARGLLRSVARDGRTVVVAGRDIDEMCRVADQVVVMAEGSRMAELSMAALRALSPGSLRVRTREPSRLVTVLEAAGMTADIQPDRSVVVTGAGAADVEGRAADAGIRLENLALAG